MLSAQAACRAAHAASFPFGARAAANVAAVTNRGDDRMGQGRIVGVEGAVDDDVGRIPCGAFRLGIGP